MFWDEIGEFCDKNQIQLKGIAFSHGVDGGYTWCYQYYNYDFHLFISEYSKLYGERFRTPFTSGKLRLMVSDDGVFFDIVCESYDEEEILKAFQNKIQELVKTL